MTRLILRDWEASAWHAGRLSAVVRLFMARYDWYVEDGQPFYRDYVFAEPEPVAVTCPLGPTGRRLWIAETCRLWCPDVEWYCRYRAGSDVVELPVEWDEGPQHLRPQDSCIDQEPLHWRSPVTMPQWASRSTAVHLGSRLVRVQELAGSDDECVVRGAYDNGQSAWHANVWVWLHRIGRE